jgi:NAD+ diphosphatase
VTGYRELGRLALAREAVDRATAHRSDPDWLAAAWHSPATRVVVVSEGGALVRFAEGRADLVFVSPAEAPPGVRFLLGTGPDGVAYFGVDAPLDQASPDGQRGQRGQRAPDGATVRPASLRQVGALLGDRDAGLLTHAIALANWHDTHTHCPICGTPTTVNPGGHSTTCPRDGTEHFPRTDPAVIMLVTDPADRCLLANNKAWPQRRVSILAGFVDPGESAEHAVVREVSEETGIAVGQVTYLGSQPWPMPRSLMLGFHALAEGGQRIRVDADEIGEAHWYSREQLRESLAARELALPPPVSIARQIIETWYGGELPDGANFE